MEVRMAKKDAVILKRKHNDYMREIVNLRAEETAEKKMIVKGKAITYDDPTLLFEFDGGEAYGFAADNTASKAGTAVRVGFAAAGSAPSYAALFYSRLCCR
jgi:hypothetical protein